MASGPDSTQRQVSRLDDEAWGPVVQGLSASVNVGSESFPAGGSIPMRYRLRNVSAEPVIVVNAGFWPNHRVDVEQEDGSPAVRTEAGKMALAVFNSGTRRKTVARTLSPQEILTETHDIATHFQFRSGHRYRLTITYSEGGFVLPSNSVEFTVR